MAIKIQEYVAEQTILVSYVGIVTVDCINQSAKVTDAFIRKYGEGVYRISDMRLATSTFEHFVEIMKNAQTYVPGTITDRRMNVVFVGTSKWLHLAHEMYARPEYADRQVPMFATLEEAFRFIDQQQAAHTA